MWRDFRNTTGSPATPRMAPRNSASTCWTKGDITAEFSLPLLEQLFRNIPEVHGWFTSGTPAPAESSKVSGGSVAEVAPGYYRLQSSLMCSWEFNQRISVFSQTSETRYLFKNNSWWEQDSCTTHVNKTGLLTCPIMSCASAAEVW